MSERIFNQTSLKLNVFKEPVMSEDERILTLFRSGLSLQALKTMDLYLLNIDINDPESRTLVFSKTHYERILGVKRVKTKCLESCLNNLSQPIAATADENNSDRKELWFDTAEITLNHEHNIMEITMSCSETARKIFANTKIMNALKYGLKEAISFKSKYSYILYLYLRSNLRKKSWTISLERLKNKLGFIGTEYYNDFNRLKSVLINDCKKEIESKTDLRFDIETVKKDRTIIAVTFTVSKNK